MTTFDLINTWPKNCDYPLWRQFIRDNRTRLNLVITAFMTPNCLPDFSPFIRKSMFADYTLFLEAPKPSGPGDDWRDLAVNASLLHSYNAEWLWFTEQDFYPRDGFWENIESQIAEGREVIAAYQGPRLHPCCIFIKRETLSKTSKWFGIMPGIYDHFGKIQTDLEAIGVDIGVIPPELYMHYNGLSQNWRLACIGDVPNYELPVFIDWLKKCLNVTVEQSPEFTEIAHAVISKYDTKPEDGTETNP